MEKMLKLSSSQLEPAKNLQIKKVPMKTVNQPETKRKTIPKENKPTSESKNIPESDNVASTSKAQTKSISRKRKVRNKMIVEPIQTFIETFLK